MNSTSQIVLRKKPNSLGLYPIAIRITKNRRSTFHYIGHYIELRDWDEKNKLVKSTNPNSKELNELISSKLKAVNNKLIKLQTKNKDRNIAVIKKEIYSSPKKLTFFEIAKEHLTELEASDRLNRLSCDKALVNYVKKFNKSSQLPFSQIDEKFLIKLQIYLKKHLNLSETTIVNVLVLIRLLFNKAIREKVIKKKYYPFGRHKIKIKRPESMKIGLNTDEIKSIESLKNLTPMEWHSRNVWLYSFNFAGMRVSDVLKTRWSDIKNDRLYYKMGKNSKLVSLKVPDKIKSIIEHYKHDKRSSNDFIFPELKKINIKNAKELHNKIKNSNKKFNDNLKSIAEKAEIDKKITMHIARHSFGNIAGDNIHPLMLQKLYRHSDLKTTLNYQANFIHREADDALDSVINF